MPLTDVQWARIEPLLPDRAPRRGGRWRDHREVIDAIAWKFQTGSQWVHLPERYGSWKGAHLRRRGIKAVIPIPADQRAHRERRGSQGGRPPAFDHEAYKQRNTVERCINRLKQWRGIATRYEKTATVYLAGLHLAGIFLWSAR
ncbi:transposase [Streptomyces sp. NPDC090798]|uniref:transposase n=1 Tax=Streptomyces sp. NPDC090798 TaxID=3365968 RepID=UPI00381A6BF8